MKDNLINHHRHSIRLTDYDYSKSGLYFLTICTKDKELLFALIENDEMILNEYGKIVREEWLKSREIRKEIELDKFIIMPNHIHGIVFLKSKKSLCNNSVGAHGRAPLRCFKRAPVPIKSIHKEILIPVQDNSIWSYALIVCHPRENGNP